MTYMIIYDVPNIENAELQKFENVTAARIALDKLSETRHGLMFNDIDGLKDLSMSVCIKLYNQFVPEDKQVKKFGNASIAKVRLLQVMKNVPQEATPKRAKKEKKVREPRPPKEKKPSVRAAEHSKVITLITTENPRKAGTEAHKLFALYTTGMTVGDYIKAGGSLGRIKTDLEKGRIKVEDAKS